MFTSQWHMHRMGLVDFWYYVNEEFLFNEGHMLLRGSNGSGKSVTMQSFIPLLLDGNKSSERLDSFGTRSRKLENYLLEEEGERDDRIGYLYLEFKRADSDLYKTIGLGLHARKNKPLDSWYFVIEDNQRVNKDLFLMENDLAITKQMLKNKIGVQVIDSQRDYMAKVNQALFGFTNSDEYKDVIQLLIQLRSPKLSNSLKPTSINEILSNSLQPLSEEDLRPMSEVITNMDDTKLKLDALKQSYQAAKTINEAYFTYNKSVLLEKTTRYIEEKDELKKLEQNLINTNNSTIELNDSLNHSQKVINDLTVEKEILEEERRSLVQSDIIQLIDEIDRLKASLIKQENLLQTKTKQEEAKESSCIDIKNKYKKYQEESEDYLMQLEKEFKELNILQETLDFVEHDIIKNEVMNKPNLDFDFTYTKKRIQEEMNALKEGLQLYQQLTINQDKKANLLNEKEQQLVKLEQTESNIVSFQKLYLDTVEEYKEKFYHLNRENKFILLSNQELTKITNYLQEFELEDNYYKIDQMISDQHQVSLSKIITKQSQLKHELQLIQKTLNELTTQYEYWQDLVDLEPVLSDEEKANRQYLKEENIAYRPLYTLLEFEEDTDEKQRDLWEELLNKSGLLNALIVEQKDHDKVLNLRVGMSDRYLFTTASLSSLSPVYLKDIDLNAVMQTLDITVESIELAHHYVKLGHMVVTLSHTEKNLYIGKLARERLRQSKLDELTLQIGDLKQQQEQFELDVQQTHTDEELLTKEYNQYPTRYDLESVKKELLQYEAVQKDLLLKISEIEKEIKIEEEKMHSINHQIVEIADKLKISVNYHVFLERYDTFEDYLSHLMEFANIHTKYVSKFEQYLSAKNQYEDAIIDLDYLRDERRHLVNEIDKVKQVIDINQDLVKKQGGTDVVKRLDSISSRLSEIPEVMNNTQRKLGELSNSLVNMNQQILIIEKEISLQKDKTLIYQQYYYDEANLHYVLSQEEDVKDVKKVFHYLNQTKSDKQKLVLQNTLQQIFQNQRPFLQEYNLITTPVFDDKEDPFVLRLSIYGRYKGNKIHFTQLLDGLAEDIEIQGALLKENERELIEDILVNDMSRKIRRLIASSEQWVLDMNRFMDDMNTSSGLKLNLEWKSRKAENDEELSSQKLVKLLKTDVHLLKSNDLTQLSSHFQSKIATARKLSEKEEVNESFHQIMRHVMDYRNWFDFTIMYEKTGDKKKELTNNAFYQFSGGEKAMSMYVPLFSAVAAKYATANEDAPMLIALDEAFAGVDEKNIDTMFELIGKFGFDYIMNSQVLWGDYPSVKALAIHELFRPENARYVTVISYTWNGHIKTLVDL